MYLKVRHYWWTKNDKCYKGSNYWYFPTHISSRFCGCCHVDGRAVVLIMGLQIRKRTKGSKSWFNFSKSGISHSSKYGNATVNVSRKGVRTTYNFGNGVRYVSSKGWRNRQGKSLIVGIANGMFIIAILGTIAHFIRIIL